MSNETKIGILAVVSIALLIYGYNFLKGQDILSSSDTLYVEYSDVEGLTKSAPILLSGVPIGTVLDIQFKADNPNVIIVSLDIQKDVGIPKDAEAVIESSGLIGGKQISIRFDRPCSMGACAQEGDFLKGRSEGLIESFTGGKPLDEAANNIVEGLQDLLDTLLIDQETGENSLKRTLIEVQQIVANIQSATNRLDVLMARSSNSIAATTSNLASVTGNIKDNNENISRLIGNASTFSNQLNEINLSNTMSEVDRTVIGARQTVERLEASMAGIDEAVGNLNGLIADIKNGEGTLGQLATSDSLYNNLNRTLIATELLLRDFRLNSKDYVRFSVFGRNRKRESLEEDEEFLERIGTN